MSEGRIEQIGTPFGDLQLPEHGVRRIVRRDAQPRERRGHRCRGRSSLDRWPGGAGRAGSRPTRRRMAASRWLFGPRASHSARERSDRTGCTGPSRTSTSSGRSCASGCASARATDGEPPSVGRARHLQRAAPATPRRRRGRHDLVPAGGVLRAGCSARCGDGVARRSARRCDRSASTGSTSSSSTRTARSSTSDPMWSGWAVTLAAALRAATGRPSRGTALRDARLRRRFECRPARRRPGRHADGPPARADARRAASTRA